jgi:hypothetical protein
MQKHFGSLVLVLLTLALSGCSSCPCKNTAENIPAANTAPQVAAPAVAPIVKKSAPVTPVAPAKKIPAAVMK